METMEEVKAVNLDLIRELESAKDEIKAHSKWVAKMIKTMRSAR